MKYMGSKARLAKYILPILNANRRGGGGIAQWYVEPFVGGANMIDKVGGLRLGADINPYIIAFFKALQSGWVPKERYTKEDYDYARKNMDADPALTGYLLTVLSFRGLWDGSFVGEGLKEYKTAFRDYQTESRNLVLKQAPFLKGIEFKVSDYRDLSIPSNSLIYCDPPYLDANGYIEDFDHEAFWAWCREKSDEGHTVFVSEYQAPDDFICVMETPLLNGMRAGQNEDCFVTERLFAYSKGHYLYLPTLEKTKPQSLFDF